MQALLWITGILLGVGFLMSGAMKLMGHAMATEMANKLDFADKLKLIGGAEMMGGLGALLGLIGGNWEFAGFFAGIGIVVLMLGALSYHQKGGDKPKDMMPTAMMIVLAVLYLIALTQVS